MELAYFFLAEATDLNPDGRFFVFGGGIEAVRGKSLPASIPMLSLLAKFRITEEECSQIHELKVLAKGPNGEDFLPPFVSQFGPAEIPKGLKRHAHHVVSISLRSLQLKAEGIHTFTLVVNDVDMGSTKLYVENDPSDSGASEVPRTAEEGHESE